MSEIKRSDVMAEDAIKAPLDFAKNVDVSVDAVDKLIAKLGQLGSQVSGAKSTKELSSATSDLTDAQKELDKIQKQINTSIAKNNDEYIAQKKALNDANTALREKILLGDRDAKTVTAQNSSQNVLYAALTKNRREYANLANEQARTSKEGLELKEVINQQDKSFKELSDSVGEHQSHVGAYAEQLAFLSPEISEVSKKAAEFGEKLELSAAAAGGVVAIVAALAAAFVAAKETINAYNETTVEGEEQQKRFEGAISGIKGAITKSSAEIGESLVGNNTKLLILADLLDKLSVVAPDFAKKLQKAAQDGLKAASEQIDLDDRIIENTIEKAKTELEANKLIFDSRNKILFSDEQRLEKVKESFQIRGKQLAQDIALAEENKNGLVDEIALRVKLSDEEKKSIKNGQDLSALPVEQRKQVAESIAAISALQTDSLREQRRAQQEVVTLQLEIEKKRRESILRIQTAVIDSRKAELDVIVKTNQNIIDNDDSTLGQREAALTNETSAQFEILKKDREQQLLNAENGAKERLISSNNEYASNKQLLEKALENDEALSKEKEKIQNDFQAKSEQGAHEYVTKFQGILNKGFQQVINDSQKASNAQLDALNVQFNAGTISANKYEIQKKKIDKQSKIDLLQAEIKFQKDRIATDDAFALPILEDQKKLGELEVQEAQAVADRKLEIEKKVYEERIKFQNEFLDASIQIGNNLYDAQIANIDARSKALQAGYNEDIKNAGNNQALKDKLQTEFDAKQTQLDKQRVEQERRKAEFDKKLAETKVVINTAEAVSKYLDGLPETAPLIAYAIAQGALQLAVIQSQPLPQYEQGTMSAIGGPSIVGEKGTEMYITPSGRLGFTEDNASIMDVEAGTKIFTHQKTMSFLAMAGINDVNHLSESDDRISGKLDDIKKAIYDTRQVSTNYVKNGLELLEVTKEKENFTKIRKSITMGKWVK